jgi:CubicO group peptidase (beta-lactamase class C family)
MTAGDALDLAALDRIAAGFHARGGQPGLAYGIVAGGRLAHAEGAGGQWAGGPRPHAGTVFRIASMTKSFTAAAVLALRDDGVLALDEPAADYVPELRGAVPASADAPRLSVRHLLTMTAGFPTDDPWGDRQQALPLPEFSRLLAGGVSFAWAPGTRFEYSNLGYAILGRVITAASGVAYPDFVRDRLLRPLRLGRTGFEAAEFDAGQLARGHRRAGGGWQELVPDAYGAFAPMGGVLSCVADLARWVSGFAAAFPPGDHDHGGVHPLPRATRREMQLPQVTLALPAFAQLPGEPGAGPMSYGFELFVEEHPAWGRIVSHSGGYPGFGSHMRWHPATGTGVIVLANSTYAAAPTLAAKLLDAALPQMPAAGPQPPSLVSGPAPAPGSPWPRTLQARREVGRLLRSWDDTAADRLFSENVAQDESYQERRRKIELLRERIGDFREHPGRAPEYDSPAHCRWWLRGEGGVAQAEIRLTPERHPRVQSLALAVPPAPGSPLAAVLASLVSLLNSTMLNGTVLDGTVQNAAARDWPSSVAASPALDTGLLLRQLRMAAAWAGPCRLGAFLAGNGESSVTAELDGETGRLALAVVADPGRGELHQADIMLRW